MLRHAVQSCTIHEGTKDVNRHAVNGPHHRKTLRWIAVTPDLVWMQPISRIQKQKWTTMSPVLPATDGMLVSSADDRALFACLLKVYSYWTYHISKLHQIRKKSTLLGPQQYTRQVWSRSDERFSRYAKDVHTDRQRQIPRFIVRCVCVQSASCEELLAATAVV